MKAYGNMRTVEANPEENLKKTSLGNSKECLRKVDGNLRKLKENLRNLRKTKETLGKPTTTKGNPTETSGIPTKAYSMQRT